MKNKGVTEYTALLEKDMKRLNEKKEVCEG
jgi:hypothetical protein